MYNRIINLADVVSGMSLQYCFVSIRTGVSCGQKISSFPTFGHWNTLHSKEWTFGQEVLGFARNAGLELEDASSQFVGESASDSAHSGDPAHHTLRRLLKASHDV